jgi:hypothetical protein
VRLKPSGTNPQRRSETASDQTFVPPQPHAADCFPFHRTHGLSGHRPCRHITASAEPLPSDCRTALGVNPRTSRLLFTPEPQVITYVRHESTSDPFRLTAVRSHLRCSTIDNRQLNQSCLLARRPNITRRSLLPSQIPSITFQPRTAELGRAHGRCAWVELAWLAPLGAELRGLYPFRRISPAYLERRHEI